MQSVQAWYAHKVPIERRTGVVIGMNKFFACYTLYSFGKELTKRSHCRGMLKLIELMKSFATFIAIEWNYVTDYSGENWIKKKNSFNSMLYKFVMQILKIHRLIINYWVAYVHLFFSVSYHTFVALCLYIFARNTLRK